MRRFSAGYLAETRRGMWEDRSALEDLDLPIHDRILDVGCGTGELTRVLREESTGTVVGLDADRTLLERTHGDRVRGDARSLPFGPGTFDLVVCQALLVNLEGPETAVTEFGRVTSNIVAAIEPDNGAVEIRSTVGAEVDLSRRAREAYIAGIDTDVTLGADLASVFRAAGLSAVSSHRYEHRRTIAPPYSEPDLEGALKKASGATLERQRSTLLAGGFTAAEYDDLRTAWREMGRAVIEQMQAGTYEREEIVPFYVTVGRR